MEPQHSAREIAAGQRYIKRGIEPTLRRACREFPVVVLTGPRQSGKTTVLRRVLSATHDYLTLETPDARAAAASDPRGFLAGTGRPLVIDEVQNAPHLLEYIKERVDVARDRPGQYVLSGSQNLLLLSQVSESLAGMGLPEWGLDGFKELGDLYETGAAAWTSPDPERLLGRPPRAFADFAADYRAAFGG